MSKWKITFDRFMVLNRWTLKPYSRNCNWTIIGVQKWWAGPKAFCYKICFFGFELQIWFERQIVEAKTAKE